MFIGNQEFDLKNETYVMGILNVTPDSFSDGGKWNTVDSALRHAQKMVSQGAAIIDVGGESTRPGYAEVSVSEEIDRTAPVIERIKKELEIPISIDTCKSEVAEAALAAGADMVNDIWGFRKDERMAAVTKKYNAACCLMHNRQTQDYQDLLTDMIHDLQISISIAKEAGIADDRILLDPGIGFGKTYEMNLKVLKNLDAFQNIGYPLLLGTSRKSVIGLALDLPKDQREEGTIVTTVLAVQKGYSFVRVHDVEKNIRAIRMTRAILNI